MSWIIRTGDSGPLYDAFTPERNADHEIDTGTRRMTVWAASEAAAMATVGVGSAHPSITGLLAASSRVTSVRHCGVLYDLEVPYKGLIASKDPRRLPMEVLEGFDTATERRFVFAASADNAKNAIALGASLTGYSSMPCVERHADPIIEGYLYEGIWSFKGFLGEKAAKYIPRGYAEKQSANPATYPGQSDGVPLESNQPLVGLTVIWASTTAPSSNVCGTNVTPAWSPGVPSNIWDSIANPIHTYPYGWVIDSRELEMIAGTTICLVTDQYTYYHRYKPGGAA